MSNTTLILGLPLIYENQYQKSVTINQAFSQIDYYVQMSVISRTNTPPASPSDQDKYIILGTPVGAWVTHAYSIAVFQENSSSWTFLTPREGWSTWSAADNGMYVYHLGVWNAVTYTLGSSSLGAIASLTPTAGTVIYGNGTTWTTQQLAATVAAFSLIFS